MRASSILWLMIPGLLGSIGVAMADTADTFLGVDTFVVVDTFVPVDTLLGVDTFVAVDTSPPADTGFTTDTAPAPADTDTGGTLDSADTGGVFDTDADTDAFDTDVVTTPVGDGNTAADLAGETGGCACSGSGAPSGWAALGLFSLVGLRRRR